MPRISIITATYNRSALLRFAIQSVQQQTFTDYEHIIVGDACTDETAQVVAAFADPRIRFVNLAEGFGEQSGPNNVGVTMARGELLAVLNHDDLWLPDHLARLTALLDTTEADLIHALPVSIDQQDLPYCGVTNAELRYDPSHFVPASFWLLRRALHTAVGGWRSSRETDASNPSQDFLFRAWRRGYDLRCNPEITALIFPSGGRPMAYQSSDDTQHRKFFERISQPGFREQLATAVAMVSVRREASAAWNWKRLTRRQFERVAAALGLHPDALRNRLTLKKRGWWIDYLRQHRGLPPIVDRPPRDK